jgi:hypothetical protein
MTETDMPPRMGIYVNPENPTVPQFWKMRASMGLLYDDTAEQGDIRWQRVGSEIHTQVYANGEWHSVPGIGPR